MKRSRLNEIIRTFQGKRVAVIGDLMLDVYVLGNASRLSPEAPVPVVRVEERKLCLGGAANVMRNLHSLEASPAAFGVVGDDSAGERLISTLQKLGATAEGIAVEKGRPTTEKQRIIAGNQQIVRVDFETEKPVSAEVRQQLTTALVKGIEKRALDAVIVENYAKGLLSENILRDIVIAARRRDIPVMLDPHPRQHLKVEGLTVLKPNRSEAFMLAGVPVSDPVFPVEQDTALRQVGENILGDWQCDYLLITLGPQGMALFAKNGCFTVIPTRAREVFDVSGAGDTVIAAFTLALLGGADAVEASEFSNHAAGVVVGKLGTVAVELPEVIKSFEEWGLVE